MADMSNLLQARYGIAAPNGVSPAAPAVNATLETLLQHKSVRAFIPDKQLPPETLQTLVAAAQSASTSSNLQTWSVVSIQDEKRKAEAATLCGNQDFIRKAPLFLLFCADLSRLTKVSEQHQSPGLGLEYTEMFLMASLDAALAAQNAAVAAESLGLGICYVGAARNQSRELSALLGLPPRVVAVFGLAVGWPDPEANKIEVKPRLPMDEVLHRETWSDDAQPQNIAAFDATLSGFNASQGRPDAPAWSLRSANRVATVKALTGRHILVDVLKERGFELR